MAKIHMILQGKGGVGKSFISSTLAQHKVAKGGNPLCIDTDPVNATFYGFKKLNVKQINVMNNDEIDPNFGVVCISPTENLYAILVEEEVNKRFQGNMGIKGPYSNPKIEPFGPPKS